MNIKQLIFYALVILDFFLLLAAIGFIFQEEFAFKYEIINQRNQTFKEGEILVYNYTFSNSTNTTSFIFTFEYSNDCFIVTENSSQVAEVCRGEMPRFPFLFSYPIDKNTSLVLVRKFGEEEIIDPIVTYSPIEELNYKGRRAIKFNSTLGEIYIVEKESGKVLMYTKTEGENKVIIELIEDKINKTD